MAASVSEALIHTGPDATTKGVQCVILGAGAPHLGQTPALLHEPVRGVRVLEWILHALNANPDQTTLVLGYGAAEIRRRYPGLACVENPAWNKTGSAMSLLEAPLEPGCTVFVCYGDILFRRQLVAALQDCNAPIAIAWDGAWQRHNQNPTTFDLARCEKVVVAPDGFVGRMGVDVPNDWASGRFIGLVRLLPEAVEVLRAMRLGVLPPSLRECHLSGLIEWLRGMGVAVAGVDVHGDWAEVRMPSDVARFILGTKADTLGRLRGLVTQATILDQVAFTVAAWHDDRQAVLDAIRARFGDQRVAIRSSARNEDGFESSRAGVYTSVLDVEPQAGLTEAIEQVVQSYRTPAPDDQVLVQPMVEGVALSGVAFTRSLEHAAPYYIISFDTSGSTDTITQGTSVNPVTLVIARDAPPERSADPRCIPLLTALREIEELLGYDALDVEFAIDHQRRVYILQVRPLVTHPNTPVEDTAIQNLRNEAAELWRQLRTAAPQIPQAEPLYGVMPDWNPAEMIGTCPTRLAESLYRFLLLDEVWATQRAEYGYRDVRPQRLLVLFAGHPYVDVRASFASFIPASVPDRLAEKLLAFYLERLRQNPHWHDKVEFEVLPTCLSFGFDTWQERLQKTGFSTPEIHQLREGLRSVTMLGMARTGRDLATVRRLEKRFDKIAQHPFSSPLDQARWLLDDCRLYGTLPFAHLARSSFIAVTLLREAVQTGLLSEEAKEGFFSSLHTVSQQLIADARAVATGQQSWQRFVGRYGHLRPGSYDITSPCYAHNPERFLRPLVKLSDKAPTSAGPIDAWQAEKSRFFAALGQLELPSHGPTVERFLRHAIEGRELAKFIFSRNLSAALEAIATYGQRQGLSRAQMAHLALEDIFFGASGQNTAGELWAAAAERARHYHCLAQACELPPLIMSEADFFSFILRTERPNFVGSNRITTDACELSLASETGMSIAGKIILIPNADPGYDWIFGHGIAGFITMYGGANSHMAIRAAEFRLPAAIGVGCQRYSQLSKATMIELDPANAVLRIVR